MSGSLYDNWLVIAFKLKNGTFSDGKNTKTCQNIRMSCSIEGDPPPKGFSAKATIFGMNEEDMNVIVGVTRTLRGSATMQIYAGDSRNKPAIVFSGWVFDARINYNEMPAVSLDITAFVLGALKSIRYKTISYKKPVKAQNIIEGIANQVGMGFENDGVDKEIRSCYLDGTVGGNIDAICRAKNIRYSIENNVIAIWSEQRNIPLPTVNVENGLVGYPTATVNSISFVTLFNPTIKYGGRVKLESVIQQCTGTFSVLSITHNLSSQSPNGDWFSAIQSYYDFSVLNQGVK